VKREQNIIEAGGATISQWDVKFLRSTGLLTQALLIRVDTSELVSMGEMHDGPGNGLPVRWQIGVEVTERLYRRMAATRNPLRQTVFVFGAETCCDFLVIVNDVGDVQHRVVMPLVGVQVSEFLAAVANGMALTVVVMSGEGTEGLATGNEHAARVAGQLQPLVRPVPLPAGDLLARTVAVPMLMTRPEVLGDRAAGLSRDDLLVSMCVPEDVADHMLMAFALEDFAGPLN
jgi:hypothetical protein